MFAAISRRGKDVSSARVTMVMSGLRSLVWGVVGGTRELRYSWLTLCYLVGDVTCTGGWRYAIGVPSCEWVPRRLI